MYQVHDFLWSHYGNKQEKCSQMNAEGWRVWGCPMCPSPNQLQKEPQKEFWQLCTSVWTERVLQNSKLTSGKVSDLYQSHKVWGQVEGCFLSDDKELIIKYKKTSCKMVIAQKDTVCQKSWCKQRQTKCLYDFATDQRRQDSHLKAGNFLSTFINSRRWCHSAALRQYPQTCRSQGLP